MDDFRSLIQPFRTKSLDWLHLYRSIHNFIQPLLQLYPSLDEETILLVVDQYVTLSLSLPLFQDAVHTHLRELQSIKPFLYPVHRVCVVCQNPLPRNSHKYCSVACRMHATYSLAKERRAYQRSLLPPKPRGRRRAARVIIYCSACGTPMERLASQATPKRAFCSDACRLSHRRAYIKDAKTIYAPHHPRANKRGLVPVRFIIVEEWLGRHLTDVEIVHHKDNNPQNNTLENLVVFPSQRLHLLWHHRPKDMKGEELLGWFHSRGIDAQTLPSNLHDEIWGS